MSLMQQHIDNRNYLNDPRTQKRPEIPEGLPTCWAICDLCSGDGRVVNPSIDAGGLSEDNMDDFDFMEAYRDGMYDIACPHCSGSGKVREIDRNRSDFAEKIAEYDEDMTMEAELDAESRAERMMGA